MKILSKNPFINLLLIASAVFLTTVLLAKFGSLLGPALFYKNQNVILITAHSLRPDHLSSYGYRNIETETIDYLSEKGILFEDVYCNTPNSFYSYAAILTGNNAGSVISRRGDNIIFAPQHKTLPDYLKSRNYVTVGIAASRTLNRIKGFGRIFDRFENIMPKPHESGSVMDGFSEKALKIIKESKKKGRPLFVWLAYPLPEFPYIIPKNHKKEKDIHPYDSQVLLLDEEISQLISGLRKLGLSRNTLTVFTSATGESLNEHNEEAHGIFLYNSAVKVPLIITLSGMKYSGTRTSEPASHIDILPTVLDVLNIKYEARSIDGISLFPLKEEKTRPIYLESLNGYYNFGWSPVVAWVMNNYKYIALPEEELYDLRGDPHEFENIAKKFPGKTEKMKDDLLRYIKNKRPGLYDKLGAGADPKEKIGLVRSVRFTADNISGIIGFYNKLLEKDPRNKTFKYVLARFYYLSGDLDRSKKELIELTEMDPDLNRAWELLGIIYERGGDPDKAVESYEKVLDIYPDSPIALNNLAWNYASKGMYLEKALEYSEKANSMVPDNPAFLDTLAVIHEKMGSIDKAEALRKRINNL